MKRYRATVSPARLETARAIFLTAGDFVAIALRDYELVVILSPEIAEDDVPGSLERLQQSITGRGGEVVDVNRWGRRRLAYPI